MYLALYLDPPEGFQRAIQDGEDFVRRRIPTNGAIWINLACAYGQFYKYHNTPPVTPEAREGAKNRALECIRNAIDIEPQSIIRLRQLYNGTGADPTDDDLKVFKGDPAFENLLGPQA
jgi:hypothetical protein